MVLIQSILQYIPNPFESLIVYDTGLTYDGILILHSLFPDLLLFKAHHHHISSFLYETSILYPDHALIWLDPAMAVHNDLSKLETYMEQAEGVFASPSAEISNHYDGNIQEKTHPLTLHILQCPKQYMTQPLLSTSCLGFHPRFHFASRLLSDWYHYSLIDTCLSPDGKNYEQNIFSILYYKYYV